MKHVCIREEVQEEENTRAVSDIWMPGSKLCAKQNDRHLDFLGSMAHQKKVLEGKALRKEISYFCYSQVCCDKSIRNVREACYHMMHMMYS